MPGTAKAHSYWGSPGSAGACSARPLSEPRNQGLEGAGGGFESAGPSPHGWPVRAEGPVNSSPCWGTFQLLEDAGLQDFALVANTMFPKSGPLVGLSTRSGKIRWLPLWGGEGEREAVGWTGEKHWSLSMAWAQPQVLRKGGQLLLRWYK